MYPSWYTHALGVVSLSEQEELVLNVLATLNNLTYYAGPDSCIVQRQTELAECECVVWNNYHSDSGTSKDLSRRT